MAEHGLSRRHWSDEVEQIIQEELANQHSIYAAWAALERRCRALGYKPSEYPKKISLHKRIDTEKARAEEFGVNLNPLIAASLEKFSH